MVQHPQPKCLVFDLEVVPKQPDQPARIIKLGALRPDNSKELELNTGKQLNEDLQRLDKMAGDASFLLGHNLIAHDLPLLHAVAPNLQLLRLPVVDTLRLSPLAFPQNPYHRLIKDYKLIRDSLNSPLADCRSALTLLLEQYQAFRRLAKTHLQELLCYQALTAPKMCSTRLARILDHDLQQPALHWPLAYVLAWLRVSDRPTVEIPTLRSR